MEKAIEKVPDKDSSSPEGIRNLFSKQDITIVTILIAHSMNI